MSAFKQKLARLGAIAGVVAGSTAAMLAVSGVSASSALATPSCFGSSPTVLHGQGSTLQREAQEKWIVGYKGKCPVPPHATFEYTGTGSGAALKAFGYNATAIETGWAYVGTDEAPNTTQIANSKSEANKVAPVIVPVAQTTIAVDVNKPAACVVTGGLTYKDLNKLFAGTLKHWTEISTMAAGVKSACTTAEAGHEITRVVRSDGSGTTYQFKNYLSALETSQSAVGPGKVEIGTTCATRTWAELRPNNGSGPPNTSWPKNGVCSVTGLTPVEAENGGGEVAKYVQEHANTIGYSALPDTKAKNATYIDLQDGTNVNNQPTYGDPVKFVENEAEELVPTTEANCADHTYTLPSGTATGLEVNWSETFGAVPTIGSPFYPLCTLTFDLGFHGYASTKVSGFTAETGTGVHDYIANYALGTEGKKVLSEHYYQALPTNVQGAAETAASKLE